MTKQKAECKVPQRNPHFVPFGQYSLIEKAVKSNRFFCIFIAGESGNGKTSMAEEAGARTGREVVVIQITKYTKEGDLIGGFQLLDGNTVWVDGPVTMGWRRGAVVVLDELPQCDAAHIMCLQGVMAGKPIHIKQTGEIVPPAPGACVVCTGNSVGEGDESREQMYANEEILNEAFRDRITAVLRHTYPPEDVETKILNNHLGKGGEKFAANLVRWANMSRQQYNTGKINRQITTRRLLHVIDNFHLFGDRATAIELAINRFDPKIYDTLRSSYFVIDPDVEAERLEGLKEAVMIEVSPDDAEMLKLLEEKGMNPDMIIGGLKRGDATVSKRVATMHPKGAAWAKNFLPKT